MPPMRITSCQAIVCCPGRNFVTVKIVTDKGIVGWGDATLNGRELAVVTLVNEHLAPLLIGQDPLRIEHLWQSLYLGAYWRGGPVQNTALSGIDMALWDILGKSAGLPVYQLLGGRCRDGALAYVHAGGKTEQDVAAAVKQQMAQGFKAVRVQMEASKGCAYGEKHAAAHRQGLPRVGVWEPTPYLRLVPRLVEHVRREVGDEVELLHDVHQRLTPTQAAGLARELEPYHLFFLEDPFGPEHVEGLGAIRAVSATPIAIGELFTDITTCIRPVSNRWLDYLRCDLGHVGGITAARKLASIAEPFAVKTAWHGPPDLSPIGHAANVHMDLAISNFGIQEWQPHAETRPGGKAAEVFRGGVTCRDGYLDVPDSPGLGVEFDEAAAANYPYKRDYLPTVRRADGTAHPW